MTRILLHGANGAMGRALRALLDAGFADCTAGPMVSRSGNGAFASFSEVLEPADIVLDFSFHTATEGALDFALEHGLPIVIGTTGHTQRERARIERASEQIPVFFSGNMSLGIAALCGLVREAARLFPEAEIEIVETHHSRKADAPSGTAITLAEGIVENLGRKQGWVNLAPGIEHATNRIERSGEAPADRIEIRSVREGAVPGIHTVTYESEDDVLELKHTIKNRRTLAMGAVVAAEFLCGKQGVYSMDDLLK